MDTTPPASISRGHYSTGQSQSERLPRRPVSVGETTPPASLSRRDYPAGQSQSERLPHRLVSVGETTPPASISRRDYPAGQSQSWTLPHRPVSVGPVSVGETTPPASISRRDYPTDQSQSWTLLRRPVSVGDYSTGGLGLGQSAPPPLHCTSFTPPPVPARTANLGTKLDTSPSARRGSHVSNLLSLSTQTNAERRTRSDEKVLYRGSSGRAQTICQLFGQL